MIGFGQENSFNKYKYVVISEINIETYRTGIYKNVWDEPAKKHLTKNLRKIGFVIYPNNRKINHLIKDKVLYCYLNLVEKKVEDNLFVTIRFKSDSNNVFYMSEGSGLLAKKAIKNALKPLLEKGKNFVPSLNYNKLNYQNDTIGEIFFSLSEEQNRFPTHIVLNIDSLSKEESFNKTIQWINKQNFTNQKKITSKIENKSINIQGLNKIEINDEEFDVRYFIELRFKDNRIKFDVIDAEIYFPDEVREKIKWGNVLLNTLSIMSLMDNATNNSENTTITYVNFGSTTKTEYIPGGWEKLSFTYSEVISTNDKEEKNIKFQILNSFSLIAKDLTNYLNKEIEKEDDW